MYRLEELVEIDRRYQTSVNLQLDLGNKEKIEQYIPTGSSTAVFHHYLENVEEKKEKATILIGPYGKGKSHLLLVLLNQLEQRPRPFLPVVISGLYPDLNQAFLMGLFDALKRKGLETIVPDSYYSEALKTIRSWKKEYPEAFARFVVELEQANWTIEDMERQLEQMSQKSLHIFQRIYKRITFGSDFQPLLNTECQTIYKNINQKLYQDYGYDGMFLVFDEFSKYVEGHQPDTFPRDMHILQEMCELASDSKSPQLHLTAVAHKSIKSYGNILPKEMINSFTGVEGRLTEIPFWVTAQNNYELIQSAIRKKKSNLLEIISQVHPYYENALESHRLPCFHDLFTQEEYLKIMVEGCYPLLPLTACLLLGISEKVGQNERSVFTFLANDEKSTAYRWVRDHNEMGEPVCADGIYDYFERLFQEDLTQTHIHAEWLKADYALSQVSEGNHRKVIKVMALLLMLGKPEELPVEEKTIQLALNLTEQTCHQILTELKEMQLVNWREKNHSYVFRNNVGVDIEKKVKEGIGRQPKQIGMGELIGKYSEMDYLLPKQYNQQYTMSRYFEYVYLPGEQFLQLESFEPFFQEHFSDGKILAVLGSQNGSWKEIWEKTKKINDSRVVVLISEGEFQGEGIVRRLLALEQLLADDLFLEDNKVLRLELRADLEDQIYELNQELRKDFLVEQGHCRVLYGQKVLPREQWQDMTLNGFISQICESLYPDSPKVNNELINRQHISVQNKKARDRIISQVLSEQQDWSHYETGTSPEATIFRATLEKTGVLSGREDMDPGSRMVLSRMTRFFTSCDGQKRSMSELYDHLMGTGSGTRKGIIPLYLAVCLARFHDTPVLYLQDKEVELSPEIIENMNEHPDDYFLFVEHTTIQKETYLTTLEKAFVPQWDQRTPETKNARLGQIVNQMQLWYRSLPQVTLYFSACPKDMEEEHFKELIAFRKCFRRIELNPRELLFDKLPEIFHSNNFQEIGVLIEQVKKELDAYLPNLIQQVISQSKQVFHGKPGDSLAACLNDWYATKSEKAKTYIGSSQVTNFMNYLSHLITNDEEDIARHLAKTVLGLYIEDWKDGTLDEFKVQLIETKKQIEENQQEKGTGQGRKHLVFTNGEGKEIERYFDSDEDDSTSYFLKNAIENAMDDFGDSLEMNQKVSVLIQTLEKLIQQ